MPSAPASSLRMNVRRKRLPAAAVISGADTAWVLVSAALVLAMIVPGLALFYGGLVRSKNVLGTIMHSFVILCLVSLLGCLLGYSLAFGPDVKGVIGSLAWAGLERRRINAACRLWPDHPASSLHGLSVDVCGDHAGAHHRCVCGADEVQRAAVLCRPVVARSSIVPLRIGSGAEDGWQDSVRWILPAARSCTSVRASAHWSVPSCWGARQGYGTDYMAPHNLPMVLLGTGLCGSGGSGSMRAARSAQMKRPSWRLSRPTPRRSRRR